MLSCSRSLWRRAERKGDETEETQQPLASVSFCCNICEIPTDEVITPPHVLLLAWPVPGAVDVHAGAHNFLSPLRAADTVGGSSRALR